jgi:hypothetical protein
MQDLASRSLPMAEEPKKKRGWKSKDEGKLTAHERQEMPKSDFALPGKGEGPKGAGSGSYPIPDASHARNALARVSQHGSAEQKAEVRTAVHRKFPGIGEKEKSKRETLYDHPRSRKMRAA